MQTIDVHDLPEPVAKAIAAMVDALRHPARSAADARSGPATGHVLAPLFQEADALVHKPGPPLNQQEAAISDAIADKFKRQGLKL